jgi:Ohr subfamily peroxiredoxin
MAPLYTANTHVVGGRDGRARSSDGELEVELAPPGSKTRSGTNPEQLFAAGYSACFLSAVTYVAGQRKIHVEDPAIDATVDLLPGDDGGFDLRARLDITATAADAGALADVIRSAHTTCPYSRATRGNIGVVITLNGSAVVEDVV